MRPGFPKGGWEGRAATWATLRPPQRALCFGATEILQTPRICRTSSDGGMGDVWGMSGDVPRICGTTGSPTENKLRRYPQQRHTLPESSRNAPTAQSGPDGAIGVALYLVLLTKRVKTPRAEMRRFRKHFLTHAVCLAPQMRFSSP